MMNYDQNKLLNCEDGFRRRFPFFQKNKQVYKIGLYLYVSFKDRFEQIRKRPRHSSANYHDNQEIFIWNQIDVLFGMLVNRARYSFLRYRVDLLFSLKEIMKWTNVRIEEDSIVICSQISNEKITSEENLLNIAYKYLLKKTYNWAFVVLQYNSSDETKKCLESIQKYYSGCSIFVIDNGSSDEHINSITEYCSKKPNIEILIIGKNIGFAKANNRGYKFAKDKGMDFIAIINNDTYFTDSNFTKETENKYKKQFFSVCGPDIILPDTYLHQNPMHVGEMNLSDWENRFSQTLAWYTFMSKKKELMDTDIVHGFPLAPDHDIWGDLILHGAALVFSPLFVKRNDFAFDDRTFLYLEEDLLYHKIKLSGGLSYYCNDAKITHSCNKSAKKTDARYFITFHKKNYLQSLQFLQADIKKLQGEIEIPKIIHICWFGGTEKSELAYRCIATWQQYMPDYRIVEWNETNCNIKENRYVSEAYEKQKWAFVSDYFRIKALYEYGGVYFDVDVEAKKSIDDLLQEKCFLGFESKRHVQTAVMGCVPRFWLFYEWLKTYEERKFIFEDGSMDQVTNVVVLTNILKKYGLQFSGKKQYVKDVCVLSPDILTIDIKNKKCKTIHHFDGSWMDGKFPVEGQKRYIQTYYKENPYSLNNVMRILTKR